MTILNSTPENVRRRDFLLKLMAIPAAAGIAIPLLTDDADAQQRIPGLPPNGAKGRKGGKRGKGKAPGSGGPKGPVPAAKGKNKAAGKNKGKNPAPGADPIPSN